MLRNWRPFIWRIKGGYPASSGMNLCLVMNEEVVILSQLTPINEAISPRRHSLFDHVRCMDLADPAHQALHLSNTIRSAQDSLTLAEPRERPKDAGRTNYNEHRALPVSLGVARRTDRSALRALRPVDVKCKERRWLNYSKLLPKIHEMRNFDTCKLLFYMIVFYTAAYQVWRARLRLRRPVCVELSTRGLTCCLWSWTV